MFLALAGLNVVRRSSPSRAQDQFGVTAWPSGYPPFHTRASLAWWAPSLAPVKLPPMLSLSTAAPAPDGAACSCDALLLNLGVVGGLPTFAARSPAPLSARSQRAIEAPLAMWRVGHRAGQHGPRLPKIAPGLEGPQPRGIWSSQQHTPPPVSGHPSPLRPALPPTQQSRGGMGGGSIFRSCHCASPPGGAVGRGQAAAIDLLRCGCAAANALCQPAHRVGARAAWKELEQLASRCGRVPVLRVASVRRLPAPSMPMAAFEMEGEGEVLAQAEAGLAPHTAGRSCWQTDGSLDAWLVRVVPCSPEDRWRIALALRVHELLLTPQRAP